MDGCEILRWAKQGIHAEQEQNITYIPKTWKLVSENKWKSTVYNWGTLYQPGLTSIPSWIINHMPSKVWDEIT